MGIVLALLPWHPPSPTAMTDKRLQDEADTSNMKRGSELQARTGRRPPVQPPAKRGERTERAESGRRGTA